MSDDLDLGEEVQDEYIKRRGVYLIAVDSYHDSATNADYKGTRYIKFNIHDEHSLAKTTLMFWTANEKDSEARAKLKKKMLRDFLTNLGCDMSEKSGRALLDSTVGRLCKVALREKEKIFYGKEDGKPKIIVDVEYYYSGNADVTLTANESKMFSPLPPGLKQKYDTELAAWNEKNNASAQNDPIQALTEEEDEKDMPF